MYFPLLCFVAMDPERQKRKEEIEKALGFIQYAILLLSFSLLHAQVGCLMILFCGSAGHLCLSLILMVMRSVCHHLSLRNMYLLVMCVLMLSNNSVYLSTLQAFLTHLVCNLLDEGNAVFRDGDLRQAAVHYSEGVNVARYAQSEALVIPPELLDSLYVNRASAHYSLVSAIMFFLLSVV